MRTAFEKGYNVITLTDCCAAGSPEGHKAAVEGTYTLFSKPVTKDEFVEMLNKAPVEAGQTSEEEK